MSEHPDVERIRGALNARGAATPSDGDAALLDELLADDVVWHGAPNGSGEARGRRMIALWNAFGPGRGRGRRGLRRRRARGRHRRGIGGRAGQVRQATIFHMNADGKVAELWGMPSDSAIALPLRRASRYPRIRTWPRSSRPRRRGSAASSAPRTPRRSASSSLTASSGTWAARASLRKRRPRTPSTRCRQVQDVQAGDRRNAFFDIHEVYADDTHAASFVTLTADHPDHPDRHMNVKEVNIFHLDSDGRASSSGASRPTRTSGTRSGGTTGRPRTSWRRRRRRSGSLRCCVDGDRRVDLDAEGASAAGPHARPGAHAHQPGRGLVHPRGRALVHLDGEVHRFKAGDTAYKPKGVPHTIFNDTDQPATFIELCWPGGLDDYLEDMAGVLGERRPARLRADRRDRREARDRVRLLEHRDAQREVRRASGSACSARPRTRPEEYGRPVSRPAFRPSRAGLRAPATHRF